MTQPPRDDSGFPRYAERPPEGNQSYGERPAEPQRPDTWQPPGSPNTRGPAPYPNTGGSPPYPTTGGSPPYPTTGGSPPVYPYAGSPPPNPYAYGYGYGPAVPTAHTNGLAIAALVLGLIGLLFFPIGPVTAVLGIVALVGIRRRHERGTGMAVTGLVLGSLQTVVAGIFLTVGLSGGFDEPEAEPTPAPPPATATAKSETFIGDLPVGTCFDENDPDSGGDVYVMFCSEPHDGEITAEVRLTARAYPGDRALQDEAEKSCDREFERYVGSSVYRTSLEPNFFYPDREAWEHGDREVSCVAMGPDGDKLDSSVRGSKR